MYCGAALFIVFFPLGLKPEDINGKEREMGNLSFAEDAGRITINITSVIPSYSPYGSIFLSWSSQDTQFRPTSDTISQTLFYDNWNSVQNKSFTFDIVDDDLVERNESFYLLHKTAGGDTSILEYITIIDNDKDSLSFSVADAPAIVEGGQASFTVSLNKAADYAVSINYATKNGTAVAGEDYTAQSGTLTFAAGETKKTITVQTINDDDDELDEAYTVILNNASASSGAAPVVSDSEASGAILDDDENHAPVTPVVAFDVLEHGTTSGSRFVQSSVGYPVSLDPDGDNLTFTFTQPTKGSVVPTGDGKFTYVMSLYEHGDNNLGSPDDYFTYTASDGNLKSTGIVYLRLDTCSNLRSEVDASFQLKKQDLLDEVAELKGKIEFNDFVIDASRSGLRAIDSALKYQATYTALKHIPGLPALGNLLVDIVDEVIDEGDTSAAKAAKIEMDYVSQQVRDFGTRPGTYQTLYNRLSRDWDVAEDGGKLIDMLKVKSDFQSKIQSGLARNTEYEAQVEFLMNTKFEELRKEQITALSHYDCVL
jgi:hypothetical protein